MSSDLVIVMGSLLAVGFLAAGLAEFVGLSRQRRRAVVDSTMSREERVAAGAHRLGERYALTRPGRWLDRELDMAGIRWSPLAVTLAALAVTGLVTWLMARLIAPRLALLGVLLGYLGLREFLHRAKQRRTEAFVNQLPEIARVMANASGAGLSLPVAIAMAAEETGEPAHTELGRIETRIRFGAPLQTALDELRERIDSREVSVLMSTLVVASRSGGSLVTALRDIAETLEDRKETRREVNTILSQAMATAYMVIAIGFGMLLLLNFLWPGSVDVMLHNVLGQVALTIGFGLFAVGFLLIRRMTKVEL